jgi:hypothetical protein
MTEVRMALEGAVSGILVCPADLLIAGCSWRTGFVLDRRTTIADGTTADVEVETVVGYFGPLDRMKVRVVVGVVRVHLPSTYGAHSHAMQLAEARKSRSGRAVWVAEEVH